MNVQLNKDLSPLCFHKPTGMSFEFTRIASTVLQEMDDGYVDTGTAMV